MRKLILPLLVLIGSLTLISCQDKVADRQKEYKEIAYNNLQNILSNGKGWEKIHAAEYLLDLGYKENILPIFLQENKSNDRSSPYFIGVWRVLAKVDEAHKDVWIGHIHAIFKDKTSLYREHALESLAKLKLNSNIYYEEFLNDTTLQNNVGLRIFGLWTARHNSQNADKLYQYASDDQLDIKNRKRALYVLRYLKSLTAVQWTSLGNSAIKESDTAALKADLLMAAYVNTPKDLRTSDLFNKVESSLLKLLDGKKPASSDVFQTLAEFGSSSILEKIEDAKEENPGINYAILKVNSIHGKTLGVIDWTIIALYLGSMLLIGWYYSTKNKNSEDYTLGGRTMNPIAVGISLFATLLSTLSYLSYPGEMVKYGPVIFTGMFAFPLVYWAVGWWIIPKIMKLNVTSAYEILELKLGLKVRMLAVFFFLFLRILWMATIMYVTIDVALFSIVPLDKSLAPVFGLVMLIITIIYTSMGGIKAVVITDVVQSLILIFGTVLCVGYVMYDFGSVTSWLPKEWFGHWSSFKIGFDTRERLTVGNAVLTLFLWYICTAGGDQTAIQRYLSTKDVKAARKTLGVSLITNLAAKILLALVGLALLAYFTKNTHMLKYGQTLQEQADVLFPHFILVSLPQGLSGLLIAALLAAAMSSLSSGLNSVATVVSEDLLKRFKVVFFESRSDLSKIKLLSYLIGIVVMILSLYIGHVDGNLIDISNKIVNLFVAPIFVLFFMAFFIPFARPLSTFIAGIVSISTGVAIAFFGFMNITVLWILPMSLFTGVLAGVFLSWIEKYTFSSKE